MSPRVGGMYDMHIHSLIKKKLLIQPFISVWTHGFLKILCVIIQYYNRMLAFILLIKVSSFGH